MRGYPFFACFRPLTLLFVFLSFFSFANSAHSETEEYRSGVERALQAALEKLSPEGRSDFRRSQKEWASFVDAYCSSKILPQYENKDECKTKNYEQRAYELESAVVTTKQGLVIQRAEYFATHLVKVTDDDGNPVMESTTTYDSWPQIDNPANDGHRKWNASMAKGHPFDHETEGHYCDQSVRYKISLTGPDFISLAVRHYEYCHGTPHGWGYTINKNRVLSADRDVETADLFSPTSGWEDALAKLCLAKLLSEGKREIDEPRVKKYVVDPHTWNFLPEGLNVNIGYISGYAGGEYEALILWKDLKPYVAANSPIFPRDTL